MKFAVRLFTFCINSKSERRVPIVPGAGVWGGCISYLQLLQRNTHEAFKRENGKSRKEQ